MWPWWNGPWSWSPPQLQEGGTRHVTLVYEFSGVNESPVEGEFIINRGRMWTEKNITQTISAIRNVRTGKIVPVSAVSNDRLDTTGCVFKSGDFFLVTTPFDRPWVLQNEDNVVISVDCKLCGWSYPRKQLINGYCKECIDKGEG